MSAATRLQELLTTAGQARRTGQLGTAARLYLQVLELSPDHVDALQHLGDVLRQLGQPDEALAHFRRAAALAPADFLAQANVGQMLLQLGRAAEAVPFCREAVRLQPQRAILHLILGDALRGAEHFDEARAAYQQAIRLQPELAHAHASLGLLFRKQQKNHLAFAPLRRAVELAPRNDSFWKYLAEAHADWEEFAEAIRCWQQVTALQPGQPEPHLGLGAALLEAGRLTEAEEQNREALRLRPDLPEAYYGLAGLHEQRGETARAEAAYREALRLNPAYTLARVRLVRLLRGRVSAGDRQTLEERLAAPQTDEAGRILLGSALTTVLDAAGDFAGAAACAGRVQVLRRERARRRGGYDPERHRRFTEEMIRAFGPDFFQRTAGAGSDTRRPVFIVGLPRSGTSLVEQILASHPRVHGAGELRFGWQSLMAIPDVLGRDQAPLHCVPDLHPDAVRTLAERHLARLDALDGGRPERIIDKLPDNYQYLGLLATLFPRATFIHCRRDLRDVALSCWLTDFRWMDWNSDFDHIAERFAAYRRLMEHWRRVLPVPLHEVEYEEIVGDLECAGRRLVAACGLEWDPACLAFHATRRPVRTASAAQVRTPLYRDSVGRWRHYEHPLADLFARVVPAGE